MGVATAFCSFPTISGANWWPRGQAGDVLELDLTTEPGAAGIRNRYAECRQISALGKSSSGDPQTVEGDHAR